MASTQDPAVYEERWNRHVKDLYGLRHELPKEEWDRLKETIEEFEDLVEIASENMEDDGGSEP